MHFSWTKNTDAAAAIQYACNFFDDRLDNAIYDAPRDDAVKQ